MQEESETFKIFSDLYHDKRIALNKLHFKVAKLEKLGVFIQYKKEKNANSINKRKKSKI